MYSLSTSLREVDGVGAVLAEKLSQNGLHTVKDLLLQVPLRYEDRSHLTTIDQLVPGELMTIEAVLDTVSQFRKNGKLIVTATVSDATGKLKLMWFNVSFIIKSLKKGQTYVISGKLGKTRIMSHPTVELAKAETLHTNRIVPLYTSTLDFKQGVLRRILKNICDNLSPVANSLDAVLPEVRSLNKTLTALHFPDQPEDVVASRHRLAVEELVSLILSSNQIKQNWINNKKAFPISHQSMPNLPFELTQAQLRCIREISEDINVTVPMNRLLLGDVGAGKTVVAGIAMQDTCTAGRHAALVAPTQILAEQHAKTLLRLFPQSQILLITGRGVKQLSGTTQTQSSTKASQPSPDQPCMLVGTHAVLNYIEDQAQPLPLGLIVYDEQHRFGVEQRSQLINYLNHDGTTPHMLSMTATPIPRSLMLTIFSHLQLSVIDQLPANRIPTKTWLVTETKRNDSYDWCRSVIKEGKGSTEVLTIIVCPFIDPSESEAFSHVPSATQRYAELTQYFEGSDIKVELLHGRQSAKVKDEIISRLYQNKIDILVTTPIVEVGIDLPQASVMIIEAAERFGLATLHQLRGRVGRAGQQGYCLLFTAKPPAALQKERLQFFSTTLKGQLLAEYDLEHRGAGDLFGTDQSGFEQLHFASWSDHQTIHLAQTAVHQLLATTQLDILFPPQLVSQTLKIGAN